MKDDAESKARTRMNRAHAVPHIDSVIASASLYGTVLRCKDHDFALLGGQDLTARLCPRSLFHEQKLTTGKIAVRPAEEGGELQRERDRSIDILMKAVIIPSTVTK